MAVCQHKESQLLEKLRQKEHLSQGVGNQLEQQRELMSFFKKRKKRTYQLGSGGARL